MAQNTQSALERQRINPPLDGEGKHSFEEFARSPQGQRLREEWARENMETAVNDSTVTLWARVNAKREGSRVIFEWRVDSSRNPDDYYALVGASDLPSEPTRENYNFTTLANGRGNGRATLDLDEGHVYLFRVIFTSRVTHKSSEALLVELKVAIPLSDETRELIALGEKLDGHDPAERLRFELGTFRAAQDAFDQICREEIAKIKAKGLSPEEEQEQIEDFKDYARQVRSRNQA